MITVITAAAAASGLHSAGLLCWSLYTHIVTIAAQHPAVVRRCPLYQADEKTGLNAHQEVDLVCCLIAVTRLV